MNSDSLQVVSGNKLMDSLKVGVAGPGLREKVFLKDLRWQGRASMMWSGARAVRTYFSL